MTIDLFKSELSALLSGLPADEREKAVSFYTECIEDGVESGKSEEEAVFALGNVRDIAQKILAETPGAGRYGYAPPGAAPPRYNNGSPPPYTGVNGNNAGANGSNTYNTGANGPAGTYYPNSAAKQRRSDNKTLWIILLIVGSPLWLSLGIGGLAAVFGLLVGAGAILFSFFAVAVSFIISFFGILVYSLITMAASPASSFFAIGIGLILLGSGILILIGSVSLTKLAYQGLSAAIKALNGAFSNRRQFKN
ncbi:MAG: DUF1700 domain-containing protein [Oscillospiraceae bacterium]|nr:DUF1700 domain-containing protein [Oscillospiraceae bacterium]